MDREVELLKLQVEAWKTTIEVQKHFNDLEMKVRNFGILLLSAIIGVIGVVLKSGNVVTLFDYTFSISAFFALTALLLWQLFFFVDLKWYHPLLGGAVKHSNEIEKELAPLISGIGLSTKISEASAVDFFCKKNMRSAEKIKLFYGGVSFLLFLLFIVLLFVEKIEKPDETMEPDNIKTQLNQDVTESKVMDAISVDAFIEKNTVKNVQEHVLHSVTTLESQPKVDIQDEKAKHVEVDSPEVINLNTDKGIPHDIQTKNK